MALPLEGIRVLDFTRHLPGPFATDLLRRLGAEVIKIEPPDGDPARWAPPFIGNHGALYVLLNSGKRSVVVDLRTSEGRAFVRALATHCDVVVESYRPGAAAALGVDGESLRALNPRLVTCSLSGFGPAVSRSGHDLDFVALSGLLDLQRDRQGRPVLPSIQAGDMSGALFCAISILSALVGRERSGTGQSIDISMAGTTRAIMPAIEALYRGTHQTHAEFALGGALPSYDVYETRDGKWLAVAPLEPRFWATFCNAISRPDLAARQHDQINREEIRREIATTLSARTRDEWEAVFSTVDACVEPVLSVEEAHERFGGPDATHPFHANFGSAGGVPEPLGDSFEFAAQVAGFDAREIAALRESGSFSPAVSLKRALF